MEQPILFDTLQPRNPAYADRVMVSLPQGPPGVSLVAPSFSVSFSRVIFTSETQLAGNVQRFVWRSVLELELRCAVRDATAMLGIGFDCWLLLCHWCTGVELPVAVHLLFSDRNRNHTPWKFNIAPENIPSEKESSLPTIILGYVKLREGNFCNLSLLGRPCKAVSRLDLVAGIASQNWKKKVEGSRAGFFGKECSNRSGATEPQNKFSHSQNDRNDVSFCESRNWCGQFFGSVLTQSFAQPLTDRGALLIRCVSANSPNLPSRRYPQQQQNDRQVMYSVWWQSELQPTGSWNEVECVSLTDPFSQVVAAALRIRFLPSRHSKDL